MYQTLIPCPGCARHLRATERACPFCDTVLPHDLRERAAPDTSRRLSRAAAFAFGLGIAGCSSTAAGTDAAVDVPVPSDRGSAGDSAVAPDTGVGTDVPSPRDVTPPRDANGPDDDGGGAAEYGAPPFDAGGPSDAGAIAPLYGKPADV